MKPTSFMHCHCCMSDPASLIDSRWREFEGLMHLNTPLPPYTIQHLQVYWLYHFSKHETAIICNLSKLFVVERRFIRHLWYTVVRANGLYIRIIKPTKCINFSNLFLEWNSTFYIHGSVHRSSNLITVQQDATYSVYYISVGSSTCFGCWHPSSGARTTVITASGVD